MKLSLVGGPPLGGRVLVVDDEAKVREIYTRWLQKDGHEVVAASSGAEAVALFSSQSFDCVVSDIRMPGMSGIELLRRIRAYDTGVPVVIVTGSPTLETAVAAVDEGAARYLLKPFELGVLTSTVAEGVKSARDVKSKREAIDALGGVDKLIGDQTEFSMRFDSALTSLHMHYQPIVRLSTRGICGYEALVRTKEPSIPHPGVLFDVADRLKRVADLSRRIRHLTPGPFHTAAERGNLFVNLHVHDLLDEQLYDPNSALAALASRVVLEITERSTLDDVSDVRSRIDRLRKMGFRIAIDDLGAGYAALNSFAHLEPEFVKLDMTLLRNIHTSPVKQRVVRSMINLGRDLGSEVVSEGIETIDELECTRAMGCDLFQGYLFARPGLPFVEPKFP